MGNSIPPLTYGQATTLLVGMLIAGGCLVYLALYFINQNQSKRPPKPLLMTLLNRYRDMFYDGRFEQMSDVEFMKFVRDNAWIMVWMSAEMEERLRRKIKRSGNYIPKPEPHDQHIQA